MRVDRSDDASMKPAWLHRAGILFWMLSLSCLAMPVRAQVRLSPPQLDQLVSRIALYPDPLLAQVLAASSYPDQISDAANWSDQHSYLTGDSLAKAISDDNLPSDPSVQALLPFPSVLDLMATNMTWTRQLGDAVLDQRPDVMDAVQRMRARARDYGYLQDCPQYHVAVNDPGIIEILPLDASFYYVPVYDPLVVFARPRVGLAVGITFGPRIFIGASFAPWGWHHPAFGWREHSIIFDSHPWVRTHENRGAYVHPYAGHHAYIGPRQEHHQLRPTHPERRDERREERHDRRS